MAQEQTPPPAMPAPPPGPRPTAFGIGDPRTRVRVIGTRPAGFSDVYYALLRMSWARLLLLVVAWVLAMNSFFGLLYWLSGGIAATRPDSFVDHFFFSVQTFGTIGFGNMYPQTVAAEVIMTVEAIMSLLLNAVVTGLAFAKFARPSSRTLWAETIVISNRDHHPTLMIRLANERVNNIVEATMRCAIIRAEVTPEGERIRRVVDLPLVRHTTPSFILSWTVMHRITPESPLYGLTTEGLQQQDLTLVCTMTGLDDTLGQTIHARAAYTAENFRYGYRYDDVLNQADAQGRPVIDYGRFHNVSRAPLDWAKMGLAVPSSA